MTASAALLIVFVLVIFIGGSSYIRRRDNLSQLNQTLQTGELARWLSYNIPLPPDPRAYKLPFDPPVLYIRQRIMIFDEDERLREDTGWHINSIFETRWLKFPYEGGEEASLPQRTRGSGIIDGNIIYHVNPLKEGDNIRGYVVVMSDKVLLLYRWRVLKIFNLLLTFLAIAASAGLILLYHKSVSGPIGSLTAELKDKNRSIKDFTDDVLHELKNPLASLRAGLESGVDPAYLANEAGRAEKLLQAIGELSHYDTADYKSYQTDPLRVIEGLKQLYARRSVQFAYEEQESQGKSVNLPDEVLGRVFRNLIDNALSFSPGDESVKVSLQLKEDSMIAEVSDGGPGVAADEKEKIFNRFYTTGKRVESDEEHYGLGLAIARKIIVKGGGELSCGDNQPSGALFRFTLPLK